MKIPSIASKTNYLQHQIFHQKPDLTKQKDQDQTYYASQNLHNSKGLNFSGKVQSDFLNSKQISLITNSIINKFPDITSAELKKHIENTSKLFPHFNEKEFIKNIVTKCEFANVKDFDIVLDYIRNGHFHLLVAEDIDISNSLAYLQTKRNPNSHIKISNVEPENLATKISTMKKRNPAIIISKFSLQSLEKLAKDSPEEFFKIVKYANFIYPHGSINGINAFSLTGINEIIKKSLYSECDENIIQNFLNLCKENIQKFSPNEPVEIKFHDIRNIIPYSMDALVNSLKYKHRFFEKHDSTFMPMARIMRKMQDNAGYNLFATDMPTPFENFRNAIFKHSILYTPIKINQSLKNIHKLISEKFNNEEIVYYLPTANKPKSFNYILGSYFLINDIPKEKLVKDLSKISPTQKVVILDDYIGSGESMINHFQNLQKQNIKKENIIIASLVTTKRGLDAIKKHTSNIISNQIISQFDIAKTAAYKTEKIILNKKKLESIAADSLIGGYNGGLDNFSTFYMTPNNNNNLFFANIAPGFVLSSYGIKAAFNTFDETIKLANLDSLSPKDLNEIIEIYKQANAIIPECIINKIAEITPNDTSNLITVLNTYGKIKNPQISLKIRNYLKNSLADIDIRKVDNIFLVDNIMDVCKYLEIEPPIKFVAQMVNELQNPKSKVSDDVLLHFYLKLIDQLSPIKEVNARITEIINNLKPNNLIKFNILEDVLKISIYNSIKLPKNILKRLNEIIDNVPKQGISLELLALILKTPQIDKSKLNKVIFEKWWANIPENIKTKTEPIITEYFAQNNITESAGAI